MLRLNPQGGMFLGNQLHRVGQCCRIFNMLSIGTDSPCQRPLLSTRFLMGRVEERQHFRVFPKHALVEVPGQHLTIFLQDGNGLLDHCHLIRCQHDCLLKVVFYMPVYKRHIRYLF